MSDRNSHCLTLGALERILASTCENHDDDIVVEHLESCERCRDSLVSIAAEESLWDEFRDTLPEVLPSDEAFGKEDQRSHEQLAAMLGPTEHPNMIGRLGTYEVSGLIGSGSMGIVLKALDPRLNRYVAIKVLLPALSHDSAARQRFEREAKAIAAVSHEHVVPVYAVDEYQGLMYFTMEYIAGESLQQRIDRIGALQPKETVRIAMQVAQALGATHVQGIIHRDIKPANILLERNVERVLVTDFGLARVVNNAAMTQNGIIAGTPQYMAPEQASGRTIDHRTDLFSLGSVMYAMCTGRPPFQGGSLVATVRRVCDLDPEPILDSNPDTPEWLAAFIDKLLSKDKEHRFQSASQVAELLSLELAYLQNPRSSEEPKRLWAPRRTQGIPSHTWRFLGGGIGVLVFASLILFLFANPGVPDKDANSDEIAPAVGDALTNETASVFGVVHSFIVENDTGAFPLIDFDAAKLGSWPINRKNSQRDAMLWMAKHGFDAIGEPGTNVRGLIGVDMAAFPQSPRDSDWLEARPEDVVETLRPSKLGYPAVMSARGGTPQTYLFKTREGGQGIMQILGFTEQPRGVRVRYRLVASPDAAEARGRVVDVSPAVGQTMLDFETGVTLGPNILETDDPESADLAFPVRNDKSLEAIVSLNMRVNQLEIDNPWSTTGDRVRTLLQTAPPATPSIEIVSPDDQLPKFFAFRTADGAEGILNVYYIDHNGNVMIQYRLTNRKIGQRK